MSYDSDSTILGDSHESSTNKEDDGYMCNPGGLAVAPNGFLLPRSKAKTDHEVDPSSPLLKPASLLAHGNATSSPARKQRQLTQERQLIADRDFLDILEACRPRHTGMIPSALRALVEMHESEIEVQDVASVVSDGPRALPEWGSMDVENLQNSEAGLRTGLAATLGQDIPTLSSPIVGPSQSPSRVQTPTRVNDLELAGEKSSQSSSLVSQVSSFLLGVSFDRPFLSPQGLMQRCPSLEMDPVDDEFSTTSKEPDSSEAKEGNNDGDDTYFLDNLRRMMRSADASSVAVASPKTKSKVNSQQEPHSVGTLDPVTTVRQGEKGLALSPKSSHYARRSWAPKGNPPGGIGAALTQYRAASGGSVPGGDVESDGLQRIASTSGLSGLQLGIRQISDMAPMGLSPMLLPPALAFSAANEEHYDVRGYGRKPQDSRLLLAKERHGSGADLVNASGGLMSTSVKSGDSRNEGLRNPQGGALFSSSPPVGTRFFGRNQTEKRGANPGPTREPSSKAKSSANSRRKKAFNPFRQQDEDEVLAKVSHNRRRWSHVFAMGETEFKRRNGPNLKSLTIPALLPLYVGYFPTQSEVDHAFTFSINNITLSEFERTYYSSNKDLLMEMVRQRLTQDFQLVPPSHLNASNLRRETVREGLAYRGPDAAKESTGTIRQFLSMGHRIQVLTYDPGADIIEITRYDAKSAQRTAKSETVKYHYMCFCAETREYGKVVQTFSKYTQPYNWSKVDRIICGDNDREIREGMRFRRLMFGLIPPDFCGDIAREQAYIAKFVRLLEYFDKLREKDDTHSSLDIQIVSSSDRSSGTESVQVASTPGISGGSMQRFYVQLRKGKRDPFEWMEVVVDSTFDTSWSYRIMLHWLVASSGKVDAQVQLLQRRCSQFGLELKPFPQITVSRNVFVNPFKAPHFLVVREPEVAGKLDHALVEIDFVHDGVFYTNATKILDCIDFQEFDFGRRGWNVRVSGRQFVHRSGTLFVRLLSDKLGRTIVVILGNYLYIGRNAKHKLTSDSAFRDLLDKLLHH